MPPSADDIRREIRGHALLGPLGLGPYGVGFPVAPAADWCRMVSEAAALRDWVAAHPAEMQRHRAPTIARMVEAETGEPPALGALILAALAVGWQPRDVWCFGCAFDPPDGPGA